MASLNDYRWNSDSRERQKPRLRFLGLYVQVALAVALVIAVATSIGQDSAAGQAARYLVGHGLDAQTSWLSFGYDAPELADAPPQVVPAATGGSLSFVAPAPA